jgi:hypothetical protein
MDRNSRAPYGVAADAMAVSCKSSSVAIGAADRLRVSVASKQECRSVSRKREPDAGESYSALPCHG